MKMAALFSLAVMVVLYLAFAFVAMDFSPLAWGGFGRYLYVLMALPGSALAGCLAASGKL